MASNVLPSLKTLAFPTETKFLGTPLLSLLVPGCLSPTLQHHAHEEPSSSLHHAREFAPVAKHAPAMVLLPLAGEHLS